MQMTILQLPNKKANNFPNSNFQKLTSWQQLYRENLDQKFDFIQFKNHQSTFRQSQAANTPKPIHAKSHQVEFRSRNKTNSPSKSSSSPCYHEQKVHSLKKKTKKERVTQNWIAPSKYLLFLIPFRCHFPHFA